MGLKPNATWAIGIGVGLLVCLIAGSAIRDKASADRQASADAAADLGARRAAESGRVVQAVEGFADRACACADVVCAAAVSDDYLAFLDANVEAVNHLDVADDRRVNAAAERAAQCTAKARDAQR